MKIKKEVSVNEILSNYNMTGSFTFDANSNTPASIKGYSEKSTLYNYEPKDFSFTAYENKPIRVTYVVEDSVTSSDYYSDQEFYLYIPVSNYGYTFGGWYTDPMYTSVFNLEEVQTITSDITLYAKFNYSDYSSLVQSDKIQEVYIENYIVSTQYKKVDIFAYSSEYFEIQILDQNGIIVANINSYNAKVSLTLDLYKTYTIRNSYMNKVYVSYIFSEPVQTVQYHLIDVDTTKSYTFTYTNGCINDLVFPSDMNYRFMGWYDINGNLVIDNNGNVYDYNSKDIYARWEPII